MLDFENYPKIYFLKSQLSLFRDIMRKVKGYFLIDLKESIKICDDYMTIRQPEVDSLCSTKGVMTNLIRNVFSGFIIKDTRNNTRDTEQFKFVNCKAKQYQSLMRSIQLLKKTFKKTFICEKER